MDYSILKTYDDIDFNFKEILRYSHSEKITPLLDECILESKKMLIYKVCYKIFDIRFYDDHIDLGFVQTKSSDLKKNLQDCNKIILFASTVGLGINRLIEKYGRISPAKALIFEAIGSERVESLCDEFNNEMKKKYSLVPRFSPGYGDLSLSLQKEIVNVLECNKLLGITLNDSLLMTPSKSVTAIIGIKKEN